MLQTADGSFATLPGGLDGRPARRSFLRKEPVLPGWLAWP